MESIVEESHNRSLDDMAKAGGDAGGVRFSQQVVEYEENPYDDSLRAEEPNQFETLCDGVQSALGLVHSSLQEYLDFKDELLRHHLPPNVLLKLSLVSGKLYRSLSDLHMPTNELIRMVRVYSTPWEEKSAALKKLHEDYETKVGQLNVAISKLTLQETEAKRVARERRVLNWERLFAKVQSTKGHGRRWKFRMHDFKQKAAMGIEHLREYFHVGEESGSEDEMEDAELAAVADGTPTDAVQASEEKEEEVDVDEEEEDVKIETISDVQDNDLDEDYAFSMINPGLRKAAQMKDQFSSPEPPVETAETGVWTEEPECDHFLHVRVFKPQGLKKASEGIKCVITYGSKMYKSGLLDAPPPEEVEAARQAEEAAAAATKAAEEEAAPKSKRLIGSRKKVTIQEPSKTADQIRKEQEERRRQEMSRYEEFMIEIPESVLGGVIDDPMFDSLKVSILTGGSAEELFATGTVDMDDLHSLDAPVRYLPSDCGDATPPPPFLPGEDPELVELEPVPFPLFPVTGGRGLPAGTIPLACFWMRKQKHKTFHRLVETNHVYELVKDLTGIDLNFITKEELTREKLDVSLSPRPETPKPVVETVLKEEYDAMVAQHEEQMELLQKEYEQRLQDLADSLQAAMPAENNFVDRGISPAFSLRPTSGELREAVRIYGGGRAPSKETSQDSIGLGPAAAAVDPAAPPTAGSESAPRPKATPKKAKTEETTAPAEGGGGQKRPRLTRPLPKWGEGLPEDFLERLRLFTAAALRHREELTTRVKAEIAAEIERQLAESYKLTGKIGDDDLNRALRDVTLPALFMPSRNPAANIFNPRAHRYFHASGSAGPRLTQPPAMLSLPPIKSRVSVVNLFDVGQRLNARTGLEWLSQRAMAAGAAGGEEFLPGPQPTSAPSKASAQRTIVEEGVVEQ